MRNSIKNLGIFGLAVSALIGGACKATTDNVFQGDGGGGSGTTSGTSNGGAGGTVGQGGDTTDSVGTFVGSGGAAGGSTSSGSTCSNPQNTDDDGDGYTEMQGDCNDCDPNVSPGSVEVIGDTTSPTYVPADEDCNMKVDEAPPSCETDAVDSMDPFAAARAVELCKVSTTPNDWGVVSAAWVLPDGSPSNNSNEFHLGHGIVSAFGQNILPQAGTKMFVVSSGTARQPTDPGYSSVGGFNKNYTCGHPQGFPKESPACPGVITGTPHDGTAVELQIRVPKNANGFSFDFDFYTYEWPNFICSQYNDFFVAILSPIPMGQTDGQISFDSQGNPISVNNAFMTVCGCSGGPPCTAGGKSFTCPNGTNELVGTGFDEFGSWHAATSWLKTQAPADPGSVIKIRWGAYDSGDGVLDSTALVDNWRWIAKEGTVVVGTDPTPPTPK